MIIPRLIPAREIQIGDILECSDRVWRRVANIENQNGRLYFIIEYQHDARSALVDDWVLVGRLINHLYV